MVSERRRIKKLEIEAELLVNCFRTSPDGGWHRIVAGIPLSAKLIRTDYNPHRDSIYFLFEDNSFPEIGPADLIPSVSEPVVETMNDGSTRNTLMVS